LWSQPGPEEGAAPSLRVVSVYGRGVGAAATDGPEVPVGAFPPLDTLTSAGSDPDDVLFVLPLRAASRDWGFLALVAPPELAGQTGRDVYFQWAALLGMALDHEALVASLEHQHRDLEEAYRREQGLVAEIRASEERYALAATAANDGLWDWDVANGSVFYSSRWKSMLGFAEDEVGSELSEWFSRAHPDDAHVLKEAVAACLTGGAPPLQLEHRVRARDGAYRWVLCRAATVKAGPGLTVTRMVGSLTDITERKELEERLLHAALYDSLTGLPNRSLFMDRLEQAFARTKRSSEHRFCVLFMDLDGFK
jgi:PAS domain S-box-containing protein